MIDDFEDNDLGEFSDDNTGSQLCWRIEGDFVGQRLDKFLAAHCPDFSRANLQKQIDDGNVLVNSQTVKSKYLLKIKDLVTFSAVLTPHSHDLPENIPLDIVYQDDDVLVINKPVGLVVHAGAGNPTGTLVNALLYHYPNNAHLPRAGLVHRIDKDTSGLLLVAKTAKAQLNLIDQLKAKSVYRHYRCVVWGAALALVQHKTIDLPIARHATHRTKMAVRTNGKQAITHLLNITALNDRHALLDVALETGRTHQIRVHLSHLGYPLVGDRVYGGGAMSKKGITDEQFSAAYGFERQALHAYQLGFVHPVTGKDIVVSALMPDDMRHLVEQLQS